MRRIKSLFIGHYLNGTFKRIGKMKPKYGITNKFFAWYFIFALIFYGTILVLYVNVQKILSISETIVNKNYEIASISKKLLENLLSMEENDRKYHVLKKEDYLQYFISAKKEFEANLIRILTLESMGMTVSQHWKDLHTDFQEFSHTIEALKGNKPPESLWIPEYVLNRWTRRITIARAENQKGVEHSTRELNRQGRLSARYGLVGLGVSSLVGLVGIIFLSHSMIRPLRELLRGIRSISQDRQSKPIVIRSKDEFCELADAFNEMTVRLKEEENMRSDFISMLSHEIRTPLTSIRESVNMIGEEVMGDINPKQRKFLKIASDQIGRICNLLNHMMQVSSLESGVLKIRSHDIDTTRFVTKCIYNVNYLARKKGIRIQAQLSPKAPTIMGDPEHLQRVLHNLLDNAIKFSTNGKKIIVRVEPDRNAAFVKISVSDNGPGIPNEEQGSIFNKYYRAQGTRNHIDGVGLGLSISNNIVKCHAGTMWVESEVGKGSTFCFTVPTKKTKKGNRPVYVFGSETG